jgi:hypothetical protein
VQSLAARSENGELRSGGGDARELGPSINDSLEVVQHEQQLAVPKELDKITPRADHARDRRQDERGVAHGAEVDEPDAVAEVADELGCDLEREPRLADPARAGERDEPRAASDQLEEVGQLLLPADERLELERQVRVVQAPERRELAAAELVEVKGLGQVLQPVLAEVVQLERRVDQIARRLREENLAAVPHGGDARSADDVDTDVAVVGQRGLAGVNANPDPERRLREGELRLVSGCDGVCDAREGDEERVPLRIHLDPAVPHECVPQQPPMLGERVRVAGAELLQQTRRPLHVREQERDCAAG